MPIVIDEVVISIEVSPAETEHPASADARGALLEREGLVDECVRKVLEVLRRDHELGR